MQLDIKNVFKVGNKDGLTKAEFLSQSSKLKTYLRRLEARDRAFYKIIDDESMVSSIEAFSRLSRGKFNDIVVLGIGGSALGVVSLKEALLFYRKESDKPNLHVIDNVDPELIEKIEKTINLKKTLFIVITKSGTTPETIAPFFLFYQKAKKAGLKISEHFVLITMLGNGPLKELAQKEKIIVFPIPENLSGRFSVLSAVGLLPAKLVGLDIGKLLKGAREARNMLLNDNFKKNLPFQLAVIQYLLNKKGKSVNVMMPYCNRLKTFSDWYRQLLGESIGKEVDNNGKKVNTGITPVSALGTTDQHSLTQLINEGPNDKLIMFIKVEKQGKIISIPNVLPNQKEFAYLKGVSFNKLIHVELQATADTYTQYKRPNITIVIEKINEEELGSLFMLFSGATAFLGEFYNINAFNQPGVERSKVLTKKYLSLFA